MIINWIFRKLEIIVTLRLFSPWPALCERAWLLFITFCQICAVLRLYDKKCLNFVKILSVKIPVMYSILLVFVSVSVFAKILSVKIPVTVCIQYYWYFFQLVFFSFQYYISLGFQVLCQEKSRINTICDWFTVLTQCISFIIDINQPKIISFYLLWWLQVYE